MSEEQSNLTVEERREQAKKMAMLRTKVVNRKKLSDPKDSE